MTGTGETTFVPLTLRRRGVQRVVQARTGAHDVTLVDGMARAFYWQHLIDTGQLPSGSDVARAEGVHHSVVNELLRRRCWRRTSWSGSWTACSPGG